MDYSKMSLDELFNVIADRQTQLNALKGIYILRKMKDSGMSHGDIAMELDKRIAINSLPKIEEWL